MNFCILSSNLHSLLRELEEDWKHIKDSKEEEIMMKYVKYAHQFCNCDWGFYSVTCCAYFGEFFILYFTNSSGQKTLLIPAAYPFDYNSLPVFIVTSIFQSVLFGCWICANALSETLLSTLVNKIQS